MPSSSRKQGTQLFVVGTGRIGGTLLDQISAQAGTLKMRALANQDRMFWSEPGVNLSQWREALSQSSEPMDLEQFIEHIQASSSQDPRIFVDCTADEAVARSYARLLKHGIHVVAPNKKANSADLAYYTQLREAARVSGAQFRYETNVGAGLPIIGPLQDMVLTGDEVTKIEGVFSGTLSYLFNEFTGQAKFSDVVRKAHELGYTEPDPRDDLGGVDVARKLLILAREIGLRLELSDIEVESLVPESCVSAASPEEFFTALTKEDVTFEAKKREAEGSGQRLRYVGSIVDGRTRVSLDMLGPEHPLYNLSGSDNQITVTSTRYATRPLVVQGPGAGAEVTAAGVFADILKCAGVTH